MEFDGWLGGDWRRAWDESMQSIGNSHGCRQARSDAVGTVNYSCYGPKVVQAPRRADRDRFSPFSSIRFERNPGVRISSIDLSGEVRST